jgi:multiple antibiotic resistance protein
MQTDLIVKHALLLFVLLNPFLLAIYLLNLVRDLDLRTFVRVVSAGAFIAAAVFFPFAWLGDRIFTNVLQARFAAFLVFGGIVFLIIGLRFVFEGPQAIEMLSGPPARLAGAIAMPFMVGPGTVNAAVLAGSRMHLFSACVAIAAALAATVAILILLKLLHDWARGRSASVVERYVSIAGRISALVVGTLAVEMIFQGIEQWLSSTRIIAAG